MHHNAPSQNNQLATMNVDQLAAALSPAQRLALRRRQPSLFGDPAIVSGHGMTMRALRTRGLVKGAMPFAKLTDLGAAVITSAKVDRPEP